MSINKLVPFDVDPGLVKDDSRFKVRQGGQISMNNMRPEGGELQVIGGWEFLTTQVLTGKCRAIHVWRDNDGEINFAFGTHSKLYVLKGGGLYDITPADFVAGNEDGFGGGGFGIGGYGLGGYGIATEGIYYPQTWALDNRDGWLIANPRGGKIYVWKNDTSAVAVELAGRTSIQDEDFTGYADQTAFDVDYTRGTGVTFDAANDEIDYDGTQTADSHVYRSVSGLTAGQRYRITAQYTRTAGTIKATEDPSGTPNSGAAVSEDSGEVAHVFIATGTSHDIGVTGDVDFVGTITDLDVDQMGAPEIVETIVVAATGQICAYGCEEELGVVQNSRCVRWCDLQTSLALGFDDWTGSPTNNAGQEVLRNSGRLVRAKEVGQVIGVWTDEGLFWQLYRGLVNQTWEFVRAGRNCGLIGPNAVDVLGSQPFWCGTDHRFYTVRYGGEPVAIESPIDETFADSQAPAQHEKIFCSVLSAYNEVWWFYAHTDDGTECSRYVAFAVHEGENGKWFEGVMDRTAMHDSAPYDYPVAVAADGKAYIHEIGDTAAGDAFSWHAESGDIYMNESGTVVQIQGMRPDFDEQGGAVTVQITMRPYAQSQPGDDGYVTHTEILTPNQRKADFRISGAIANVRYSSDIAGATCRLGKSEFDIVARGER